MRLSCPNCTVEYEIADELAPKSGRTMHCSNCAHVWMHYPPLLLTDPLDEDEGAKPKSSKTQEVKKPKRSQTTKSPKTRAKSTNQTASVTGEAEEPMSSDQIVEILRDEAQYAKSVRQTTAEKPGQKPAQTTAAPKGAKAPIIKGSGIKTTPPIHFIMPSEPQEEQQDKPSRKPQKKNTKATGKADETDGFDPLTTPLQTSPYGDTDPPLAPNDQRIFFAGFQVGLCVVLLMAALYTFDTQIAAFLPSTTPILADYTAFMEQTYQQGYDFYLSSVKPSLIEFFGQEFFNQFRLLHLF
ncbi:MAG: zinc-ribbon domain-containing protein [Candidatus Halichondribacter symbioticus]